jgi:hypothetical protein
LKDKIKKYTAGYVGLKRWSSGRLGGEEVDI